MKNRTQKRIATACTVGVCTAITVVSAYIHIPLFVPITLQTLAIMLISGVFGVRVGLISTVAYILLGVMGLPVFSGGQAGISALLGPSGGFIFGFILVSAIVGIAADIFEKRGVNAFLPRFAVMLIANVLLYVCGVGFYCLVYAARDGVSVISAITLLVLPYIIPDLIKVAVAAYLAKRLSILKLNKNLGGRV